MPSAGFCRLTRCDLATSRCPEGYVEDRGTLACYPLFKPGDCDRRLSDVECPPGYVPEGDLGCRLVVPYAWRVDAGVAVPDAGQLDATNVVVDLLLFVVPDGTLLIL